MTPLVMKSVILLAFLLFFLQVTVTVSSHPGAHRKHAAQSRLWVIRKLWSSFPSSAGSGTVSPMEGYKTSSSRGSRIVEAAQTKQSDSSRKDASESDLWWASVADAVPPSLPGPTIAVDPTSLAADEEERQTSLNPDGHENMEEDIPDEIPGSNAIESSMQAMYPSASPALQKRANARGAAKSRPIGREEGPRSGYEAEMSGKDESEPMLAEKRKSATIYGMQNGEKP